MTPEKLQELIFELVKNFSAQVVLTSEDDTICQDLSIDDIVVERPKSREHGDWSTNIALKFAKKLGFNSPRDFAQEFANKLTELEENDFKIFSSVDIAGPGFINMTLNKSVSNMVILNILKNKEDYGKNNTFSGLTVNLEFVSANPTGPLHIGGVRWAAVGDSLARVFEANGAKVVREYYFNDHGSQIDNFAKSLYNVVHNLDTPENGYAGSYINDIANQIVIEAKDRGDDLTQFSEEEEFEYFRKFGVQKMFPIIKQSLVDFDVHFDVFFHEQSLYDDGKVAKAIDELEKLGNIYKKDGALWVKTTDYGDDKDRVIIKSDGSEAYFAADIAYYLDKRRRSQNPADLAIYMLGADHSGYVGRLYAVARAFGDEVHKNIEVFLGQLVKLVKNGEVVKMSKRAGNIITIDDLVDAVGTDASRYALTRSSADSSLEIDLDLLSSHSNENPVYYVQYAYARTKNVEKVVQKVLNINSVDSQTLLKNANIDISLLVDECEENLVALLAQFPSVVQISASLRSPHRIARYAEELAGAYHKWYSSCRVVPSDGVFNEALSKELSFARLSLNSATGYVLKNALNLLGVSAPEKM